MPARPTDIRAQIGAIRTLPLHSVGGLGADHWLLKWPSRASPIFRFGGSIPTGVQSPLVVGDDVPSMSRLLGTF